MKAFKVAGFCLLVLISPYIHGFTKNCSEQATCEDSYESVFEETNKKLSDFGFESDPDFQGDKVRVVKLNNSLLHSLKTLSRQIKDSKHTAKTDIAEGRSHRGKESRFSLTQDEALNYPIYASFNFSDNMTFSNGYISKIETIEEIDGFEKLTIQIKGEYKTGKSTKLYIDFNKNNISGILIDGITTYRLKQIKGRFYAIIEKKSRFKENPVPPLKEKISEEKSNTYSIGAHPETLLPSELQTIIQRSSTFGVRSVQDTTIDVLFLFENSVNSSNVISTIITPGVDTINDILQRDGVKDIYGNQISVRVARNTSGSYGYLNIPSGCGATSICTKSYTTHLKEVETSNSINSLRMQYSADAVIVIRYHTDGLGGYGLANVLPPNNVTYYAREAAGLVYSGSDSYTLAHELGHILGAGHSAYNSDKLSYPAKAFMDDYPHTNGCETHHDHPFRSFMGYEEVCNSAFLSFAAKLCDVTCDLHERFSSPSTRIVTKQGTNKYLGSSSANNLNYIKTVAAVSVKLHENLQNKDPIVKFNTIVQPNKKGMLHCWNAQGSYDPDGDDLVKFSWLLYHSSYPQTWTDLDSIDDQFCVTPSASGRQYLILAVTDSFGNIRQETKILDISD